MTLQGFEVERFEHVAVSSGTVLLRLSGRWFAMRGERLPAPVLIADDGERRHRLELLPGPEDPAPLAGPRPEVWRAAFRAPEALVDLPAAFSLSLGPGLQLDLPAPSAREGGRPATVAGRLGPPADLGRRALEERLEREAELRRAAERAAASAGEERLAVQAAAAAEHRELVARSREEVDRARDDAGAARREAAVAARAAGAAQDEAQALGRRLEAAEEDLQAQAERARSIEAALGTREDDLRAAGEAIAELRAALAARERESAEAAAEAADLRDVLRTHDRVGEAAGAEIAALAARVEELEPLAARTRAAEDDRGELEASVARLEALSARVDELLAREAELHGELAAEREQLAVLERTAGEAIERLTAAGEHARADADARGAQLDAAERRIAALGDELAAAQLAQDAQPEAALPPGPAAEAAVREQLEALGAALAAERAEHRAAAEHASRTERELADAHARLHDLDARQHARADTPQAASGPRARRRRARAAEAHGTAAGPDPAGAAAGQVVLRRDRRPAVRTPVAVGLLVVVVVGSGLLLLALLLKVAIAP